MGSFFTVYLFPYVAIQPSKIWLRSLTNSPFIFQYPPLVYMCSPITYILYLSNEVIVFFLIGHVMVTTYSYTMKYTVGAFPDNRFVIFLTSSCTEYTGELTKER
jgi:hypothetical protein